MEPFHIKTTVPSKGTIEISEEENLKEVMLEDWTAFKRGFEDGKVINSDINPVDV